MNEATATVMMPLLSVVVPVHHQERSLGMSLAALDASDLPREQWQLIVVDDASGDDGCATIAAPYADVVVRLPGTRMGAGYARNRGVELADAGVLVFVNPGVLVTRDALSRIARRFHEEPALATLCAVVELPEERVPTVAAYDVLRRLYARTITPGQTDSFTTAFAAIRKDAFVGAGMCDEWRVGVPNIADAELGERIRVLGHPIVVDAGVRGTACERLTLIQFARSRLVDHGHPWSPLLPSTHGVKDGRTTGVRHDAAAILLMWGALTAGVVAASAGSAVLWWMAAAGVAMALAVQARLLAFLASRRGASFLVAVTPLVLADCVLGGASIVYAWCVRTLIGEPRPHAVVEALAEVGVSTWPPVPTRREPAPVSPHAP